MSDNYEYLNKLRRDNECLFKDMPIVDKKGKVKNCNSQGKYATERNHLISKSSYLERISYRENVLVFDFEKKEYIIRGRKLVEKNIKDANKFHVLCGRHDKYLFNEIENGKIFDENNKKQLFQFNLRAFIFGLSENQMKDNFTNIMKDNISDKIAKVNYNIDKQRLEHYKNLLQNEKWDGVESKIIKLNRKSNFISCLCTKPNYGFLSPIRLSACNISFNVFPENDKTIIILSYLKGDMSAKYAERYCNKLVYLAKNHENKFVRYMNKFIVAFDHNIAICPLFWKNLNEEEQKSFYEIAHLFPQCKTFFSGCMAFVKLKIKKNAPKLIL